MMMVMMILSALFILKYCVVTLSSQLAKLQLPCSQVPMLPSEIRAQSPLIFLPLKFKRKAVMFFWGT